jgi:hypothetical protein
MRWLNLSDVSNFTKPSMDFKIDYQVSLSVKPVYVRFTPKVYSRVRNSSIFGKMSTAVRWKNEEPEPDGLWFSS